MWTHREHFMQIRHICNTDVFCGLQPYLSHSRRSQLLISSHLLTRRLSAPVFKPSVIMCSHMHLTPFRICKYVTGQSQQDLSPAISCGVFQRQRVMLFYSQITVGYWVKLWGSVYMHVIVKINRDSYFFTQIKKVWYICALIVETYFRLSGYFFL